MRSQGSTRPVLFPILCLNRTGDSPEPSFIGKRSGAQFAVITTLLNLAPPLNSLVYLYSIKLKTYKFAQSGAASLIDEPGLFRNMRHAGSISEYSDFSLFSFTI